MSEKPYTNAEVIFIADARTIIKGNAIDTWQIGQWSSKEFSSGISESYTITSKHLSLSTIAGEMAKALEAAKFDYDCDYPTKEAEKLIESALQSYREFMKGE